MAKKAVVDAVQARLAGWTACPVIEANTLTERPADGSPFLLVQFPVANTSRPTHSRQYVEEGAFRVVIYTEQGAGLSKAIQWGEQIGDLFRDQKLSGGVESLRPNSPTVNDDSDESLYFRTSVVVPYRYVFEG